MVQKHPSESQIKNEIRKFYGCRQDIRLFNNPVGGTKTEHGGWIDYGLAPGSSDLIGWLSVWLAGNLIAVQIAFEVKDRHGRPTKEQLAFIETVRTMGGIAGVVRSVQNCEDLIAAWCGERGIHYRAA